MGALVAADVTITKVKRQRVGLMKESLYLVAFGDASKTVPTNGIPLPALGLFGLTTVQFHQIAPVTVNGYAYRYDEAHHSLRLFQVAGFTPAGTVAAPTINIAGGEAGTVAIGIASDANGAALSKTAATARTGITGVQAPAFTGAAVAAGALSEVPTSHAPAATVLRLMLRGK